MKPSRLIAALALTVATASLAQVQIPAVPASELIRIMVANELGDRVQQRRWLYVVEKRVGAQLVTEEQVETAQGPLFRVQAMDGVPLTADQRQQDDARIGRLLDDPSQLQKLKQQHDQDEQKLENLMRVMADAFLYEYAGAEGGLVRLTFRPNPNYQAPTYETRVVHSLAGTILIDRQQQNRLAKLTGRLIERRWPAISAWCKPANCWPARSFSRVCSFDQSQRPPRTVSQMGGGGQYCAVFSSGSADSGC